jgi:hypothetical protein
MVFVKGDSRINRKGRPEGAFSVINLLMKELENIPEHLRTAPVEERKTWAQLIVKEWLNNAGIKGIQPAIDKLVDRVDGPVKQEVEVSGGLDGMFTLNEEDKILLSRLIEKKLEKL